MILLRQNTADGFIERQVSEAMEISRTMAYMQITVIYKIFLLKEKIRKMKKLIWL
jgi:hypothetical protein